MAFFTSFTPLARRASTSACAFSVGVLAKPDSCTVTLPGVFLDSNNESFALLFEKQPAGAP